MSRTVEQTMRLLHKAHEGGRLAHAFLVTGPRGVGKEELACRISEMLNGRRGEDLARSESELLRVVRPQGKMRVIPIEKMRELERELYTKVDVGSWRIGVIVDADRLNTSSENAFLKTLEEPPPNTVVILTSIRPDQLLPTVHSRCVRLELMADGSSVTADAESERLAELLSDALADGLGNESEALALAARLLAFFKELKDQYFEEADDTYKSEQERYRETTESGAWLREREKALEAVANGRFLTVRAKLVDFLIAWFGDAVRLKSGGGFLEVPRLRELSEGLAEREELESLLRRMEALEEMRWQLETNADDRLVIEVACLRAFVA